MAIAPVKYDDAGLRYASMSRWRKFIQQIKWIFEDIDSAIAASIDG